MQCVRVEEKRSGTQKSRIVDTACSPPGRYGSSLDVVVFLLHIVIHAIDIRTGPNTLRGLNFSHYLLQMSLVGSDLGQSGAPLPSKYNRNPLVDCFWEFNGTYF